MEEQWTVLMARFESMCYGCGGMIQKGDIIWNNHDKKESRHMMCKNKVLADEEL